MEILMNNTVSLSKTVDVVPEGREFFVPGTDVKVTLEKGEIMLVPDITSGREVKEVKDIVSYITFERVTVINDIVDFKANLFAEIIFFDSHCFDINRYKIPFEDRIETGIRGIRKVDLKGSQVDYSFEIVEPPVDTRLEGMKGPVVAKCLFKVNLSVEVQ